MSIALALLLLQQADQDVFSCDTTRGWGVFDTAKGTKPPELRSADGVLELSFERKSGGVTLLIAPVVLTNLRQVEFDVWSQVKTAIVLGFDDRDRAKYHHAVELQAGRWKHVKIQASEFTLNDDSPVKKPRIEPKRLSYGLGICDAAPIFGGEGPNVLRFDNFKVVRDPLPAAKLPPTIDGKTVEISGDGVGQGEIRVKNGKLRITANRFVFAGKIVVENGELEIAGGVVSLNGRFAHDLGIVGAARSTVRIREAVIVNNFVHGIAVRDGSRLEIEKTSCPLNWFTVDVQEGGAVLLDEAGRPGEFVMSEKAKLTVDSCDFVLVWLSPTEQTLKLPKGAEIDHWVLASQVTILKSRNVMWGLLSEPGSKVVIEEGELTAVGVLFDGGEHAITDLKKLGLTDRTLDTEKAYVKTWNFYPAGTTKLSITGCTVGEVIAFGEARVTFQDSTCDGTGGYFRAEGKSVVRAEKCTFTCAVVATDDAALTLEGCVVKGVVSASGAATIRMPGTTAAAVEKLDKAVIEKK